MLKRIIWILFLLGLTGGGELFAHDGTVNISGSFRRNTCVLAQDSKQINVQLGDVSLTRFSHGNYGPEKSFIINLQDCGTDVSTVDVTFSGTPDGVQSEMLSIESGTDAASGLAIAILDDAKILIPLNQASKDYSLHSGNKLFWRPEGCRATRWKLINNYAGHGSRRVYNSLTQRLITLT
ncbi:fimbrial protein [Escherichia coli]|nr:fimbrial protein [Escherichia coli]